jgi:outer membrane protein TolC
MKKLLSIALFFTFNLLLYAQDSERLTLDRAIQIGLQNSNTIKRVKSQLEQSRHSLESWKLYYASNAMLSVDAPKYTNNFREVPDPRTGKIHIIRQDWVSHRALMIVNQPILITDGNLYLKNSLYNLRQPDDITYQSDITLNYNQPLFKTSTRKISLNIAEINLDRARLNYAKEKRNLIYNITERFFYLLKTQKRLEIAQEAVKRSQNIYEMAKTKYRAGVYTEMDLLRDKVEMANDQTTLINLSVEYKDQLKAFLVFIGHKNDHEIDIAHIFSLDTLAISESQLLQEAIKNDPDKRISEMDIKLRELDVKQADAQSQFSIDMNLEYGFSQIENRLDRLLSQPDRSQIASISFDIPLWDSGQNKQSVLAAQENLTGAKLHFKSVNDQLKLHVAEIYSSLEKNKKLLEITETNKRDAEKSYRYRLMMYNAGNITREDLARARDQLNQASLNNLNAKIEYMLAVEQVRKLLTEIEEQQ